MRISTPNRLGSFIQANSTLVEGTSNDGIHWQQATPFPVSATTITWANDQFVALGPYAYTSGDGLNWQRGCRLHWECFLYVQGNIQVLWNGTQLRAFSSDRYHSTDDGLNWASNPTSGNTLYSGSRMVWTGSRYVHVWSNGFINLSEDGVVWQMADKVTTQDLNGVASNGSRIVVAGDWGTLLYSDDGISWTQGFVPSNRSLIGVAWGNGTFVAASTGGEVLTSEDGQHWELHETGVRSTLDKVFWFNGRFVIFPLYSEGRIITSPDGKRWALRRTGALGNLVELAANSEQMVLVNNEGIWRHQGALPDKPLPSLTPDKGNPPPGNDTPGNSGGGSSSFVLLSLLLLRIRHRLSVRQPYRVEL